VIVLFPFLFLVSLYSLLGLCHILLQTYYFPVRLRLIPRSEKIVTASFYVVSHPQILLISLLFYPKKVPPKFNLYQERGLWYNFIQKGTKSRTVRQLPTNQPQDVCLWKNMSVPFAFSKEFINGQICFVFFSTNTPGQRASLDVRRYTSLPGRICFVTDFCLFLLCWREAAFSNHTIFHGLPTFSHPDSLECWYLRQETALSVSA